MNEVFRPDETVDIVMPTYNGERFLPEFLESLQGQLHRAWRLWITDDGSVDGTVAIAREYARADERIRVLDADGTRRGAAAAFASVMDRVPSDTRYLMFADQDDVWLPAKIQRTLEAMLEAEQGRPDALVLVHTDMAVVDASLQVMDKSFWHYAALVPDPPRLRRYVVENVVTGAATMINRALLAHGQPVPADAMMHDWWYACVAAAFGRIVAIHEPTMLYRQHGANAIGANRRWRGELSRLPGLVRRAVRTRKVLREQVARLCAQGGAFLQRYSEALPTDDQEFLRDLAAIPNLRGMHRKREIARLLLTREHSVLSNLGFLLRA
jgi:glycosyltransferase involved in cell wall biosynthesis